MRRHQNGNMTSEEENTSSPGFSRRRMGSFSGHLAEDHAQESPGSKMFVL